MAQRRALRELAKRIRSFPSLQGSLEEASAAGRQLPARKSKPFWPSTGRPTGQAENSQNGQLVAWLLTAGGLTAMSSYTVNAGSTLSTLVETEAPAAKGTGKSSKKQEQQNRVVFVLGGPGSGKGTQCAKIVEEYGFTHLSAGDLLRAEIKSGSEFGNMIQGMIKEGKIVPAEVTVGLLKKAMAESGNSKFLIDGFPRNAENREVFERDTGIKPEFILFFDCPEKVMEQRLLGRNQGRIDDNIETIRKRFRVFVEQSIPVVEYYEKQGKVRKIDATKTPDEVFKSYSSNFIRFIHE